MGLFRKNSRVPPSGSTPGQPCAAAAGTHPKQLSKLHRAAASANMAWLRRWRWLIKIWGFDRRDWQNRTPLHLACANGHAGVANFLLRQHCQLNPADNSGRTPLMMAVQFNRESCVTLLLRRGADPNLTDVSGNTALHLAVLFCDVSVVQLLLRRHARLDAENKEGFTPLSLAVSKGQAEIAEFLRKKAAGNQDQSPSDQVAASEAQEEEAAEPAGDPDEVFILNSPLWQEAFGSTLDAAAVERGEEETCKEGLRSSEEKVTSEDENASAEQRGPRVWKVCVAQYRPDGNPLPDSKKGPKWTLHIKTTEQHSKPNIAR